LVTADNVLYALSSHDAMQRDSLI